MPEVPLDATRLLPITQLLNIHGEGESVPDSPSGIGQIHISVGDVDKAVAWYRDVLGLEFLFQVPGQPMAFFNCGGVRLYLGRPENEKFRSRPVLYYRVSDIEAAVSAVESRGGKFTDQPHLVHRDGKSELWLAGLEDSEGNPVILMEEKATQ